MAGMLAIYRSMPPKYTNDNADLSCRPSYSADWGDYISFAERLHEKADRAEVDLLLIDTGDRVEGNGLYDASDPKGKFTTVIFREQDIDIICSGNHELYKKKTSQREYLETVPNFQGNYLASNIDIYDPKSGLLVPLAQRYKKFTTKNQGIRILAFGFLYDFNNNANNTVVQPVSQTVQEKWFQEAIRDREVDLFLVTGHVPLRSPEFDLIYKAIRDQQWDVPIQFFGGHTHIRDYAKYDSNAHALESGRYMETIGFMSITGLRTGGKAASSTFGGKPEDVSMMRASPTFSRRYIDNNLFSFHHHTSLNATTFPTEHGRNVSSVISSARKSLDLDKRFGCAPTDLWTNRAPYPSKNSIFTWLQEAVLPDMLEDARRPDSPKLVLLNTGSLRFDIFKGPFTVDTTYTISPFTSGFRQIKGVPFSIAEQLLRILNQEVPQLGQVQHALRAKEPVSPEQIAIDTKGARSALGGFGSSGQILLTMDETARLPLIPGYTTTDDAGNDGDDTLHSKIKFYRVPNCIESRIGFPVLRDSGRAVDPETVDLVYGSFIEQFVLLALKFLGTDYSLGDTETYANGQTLTALIAQWGMERWTKDC